MIYIISGIIGSFLIIGSYLLVMLGKITASEKRYIYANILGSSFVIISLVRQFNVATLVIQVFWIAISIVGLWRQKT
jgi:hypothetical protein